MIGGVDLFYIVPVVTLVVVALLVGLGKSSSGDSKGAALSVFRVLLYGGFVLFLLFLAWAALYYAGGGH